MIPMCIVIETYMQNQVLWLRLKKRKGLRLDRYCVLPHSERIKQKFITNAQGDYTVSQRKSTYR